MWDFIKENWISLIALLISIIGFFKDNIKEIINYNKSKKNSKSAKISVSYINKKLIISNKGQSDARNLKIYIDDDEIEHSSIFAAYARYMNFSLLTPNNSLSIQSVVSLGSKRDYKIKVKWEDDNKKDNEMNDIINI